MTTTFYFHTASSTISGTLPSTLQFSAVTPNNKFDAVTVNRSMDTTVGTSQNSIVKSGYAPPSSPTNLSVTRFVSPLLAAQTISSNTWSYGDACTCNVSGLFYPNAVSSGSRYIAIYVWRPSSGSRVGFIANGLSATSSAWNDSAATEHVSLLTWSGSSVTCIDQDVLCVEVMVATNSSTSRTFTWWCDGTNTSNADNTTSSSYASFVSTPQTLSFYSPPSSVTCTPTGKTVTNKFIFKH